MTKTIIGSYRRRRDGRQFYTFEATWEMRENDCCWESIVRLDGSVVGTPGGKLSAVLGKDYPTLVKAQIEHCIENQIGVP